MKKLHIAIVTMAAGLCIAIIPQVMNAHKTDQTWDPPVTQKPITTTDGDNPYSDAIQNQYEMTDESLGSIDETYGQPNSQVKLPKNVKITIEVIDQNTAPRSNSHRPVLDLGITQ